MTIAAVALLLTLGALSTIRSRERVTMDAAAASVTPPAPSPVVLASRGAAGVASAATKIRVPGVVCGVVEGGGIQEVACREGPADAFGIFSVPPASRSSCDGAFQWYSAGPRRPKDAPGLPAGSSTSGRSAGCPLLELPLRDMSSMRSSYRFAT